MHYYKISLNDASALFKKMGCDKTGINIMSKKSEINTLYIKDLHVGAANILKQDALSIGADLAVPSGVIVAKDKYVDAVLIGNSKHFEMLSKKELAQPFGLKQLAHDLKKFVNFKKFDTRIMGVINANEDSFYQKSRFDGSFAIEKIENMILDGANIIDIGAVSSRPGSLPVDKETELNRIKPIVDALYQQNLYDRVTFSIDSYEPAVLRYVLDRGFKIVNDITGMINDEVAKVTASYDASIVIMHMQNNPVNMQANPEYSDVMMDVSSFFEKQIDKANDFGIKDIILDVGIGFGKDLNHNLTLLKNMEHFRSFGYEVLIGASRKSMIDKIAPSGVEERLPGTLAIHLDSIRKGASIVRCHDVKEHYQAIKTQEAILSI